MILEQPSTIRPEADKSGIESPRLTTTHGVLYQEDCLKVLGALKDRSVDCVFADPPFNLQKDYRNGFTDHLQEEDFIKWSYLWIDECCRVIAEGGALFIYTLPKWAYKYAAHLDSKGMQFRHWIALSMKGTFQRGKRLYPAHYALLYFTKNAPRVFNKVRTPILVCRNPKCGRPIKDYGGYKKHISPEGISLSDFWEDTSPNRHKHSKARPGVNELKPVIPARAIEISTKPGDLVFDPFGGGGSTFQEAQKSGRFWIGSEIGDCSAIEQRLTAFAPTTLGRKPPEKVSAAFRVSSGEDDSRERSLNHLERSERTKGANR